MVALTPTTMNELVSAYRAYLTHDRKAQPRTVTHYVEVLDEFVVFLRARLDPEELFALEAMPRAELVTFLRSSANGSVAAWRWNLRLAALRSFYRWLCTEEKISVNPANLIDRIKVPTRERDVLTFDEVLRLYDAFEDSPAYYQSRNKALMLVFYHCSIRVAELVSLDVDQVDLQAHAFHQVQTKGGKVRKIVCNDVVAAALETYLADRPDMAAQDASALFVSNRGTRMGIRSVQSLVRTYAQKAGIDRPDRHVTPHLLRHASATAHLELGTDVETIRRLLGHSNLATTQIYLHGTGDQPAVDRLGAAWQRRLDDRRRSHTDTNKTLLEDEASSSPNTPWAKNVA